MNNNNKLNGNKEKTALMTSINPKQPVIISYAKQKFAKKPLTWSQRLEIGCKLGKGRFGQVWLMRDRNTKKKYAVKSISKEYLKSYKIQSTFKQEVENMTSAQHPNIIKIYGWYHTPHNVQIVMEYAPKGEIFHILMREGPFSPERASNYIAQVASGLSYCHSMNIIHRDIKPENLLLCANNLVKICDFGSSVDCSMRRMRKTLCGTLDYLAPELINHTPYDGNVDNWALGVLAFEFLTNKPMFDLPDKYAVEEAIKGVQVIFPENFDSDAKSFISALLVENPSARMKLKDVPKHRWITKFQKQ